MSARTYTASHVPKSVGKVRCCQVAGLVCIYSMLKFVSGGLDRATQKAKYMGELFPASITADPNGLSFYEFFQTDKHTGRPKGIIAIDLRGFQ